MKSKYENDYKKAIIDLGVYDKVKHIKRDYYRKAKETIIIDRQEGVVIDDILDMSEWCNWLKENKAYPKYDCAVKLMENEHKKVKKIRNKVKELVETGNAIFVTLTFTDDILAKTSALTRRRYVARYLKEQSDIYVANIDFSPEKQREHYHAIVGCRCDLNAWKYGFSHAETIRNQDKDLKRTTKYVGKLTSHAIKVNATRLIYSRNVI